MRVPSAWFAAAVVVCAPRLLGQTVKVASEVFAGSEIESYLRVLQVVGAVPLHPWSVRAFGPRELDALTPRDTAHPWALRYDWRSRRGDSSLHALRPLTTIRFNSAFPYGGNDGPVWAGRGATGSVQAGVAVRRGALSLTVAPIAFAAQNQAFRLMATGDTGRLALRDPLYPNLVDQPQRFGRDAFAVLDPGQSTLRLDVRGVALGVSTAVEYWGPAREFPVILGNNAAGFPHLFLGTAAPVNLRILRLHGRILWGRLTQSDYSIETAAGGLRLMSGVAGVITVPAIPGLELGGARFIHATWRGGRLRLRDILAPLRYQYEQNLADTLLDNQIASVFFRWVLARSGVEVYAEYGREDYNQSRRHLVLEPDHDGGYTIGFLKVFRRPGGRLLSVGVEMQDLQPSVLARGLARPPFYVHSTSVRQGHTQRGQILGSYAGLGGMGAIAALDIYHTDGQWSFFWSRVQRGERATYLATNEVDRRSLDVQHALGIKALWFRSRLDLSAGLTAVYELNRYFAADAFNLNLFVGVQAGVP